MPRDDTYWVAIANYIQDGWIESHFPPRQAAWLLSFPVLARQNDVIVSALGWIPQPAPVRGDAAP